MLGENGVNILALSIADTVDYGILRLIVTDPDLAESVLEKSELTYNVTPVLGICVDHVPGGLSKALGILADAGHSVGYMYAFVGKAKDSAMVIIKAEDNDAAAKCLTDAGVKLFDTCRRRKYVGDNMKTILFQGDSITDVMRQRDNENANGRMGYGYPLFVTGELMAKKPEQYAFLQQRNKRQQNCGRLHARIKADIINLKPDYMSILIGVNDVWHEFDTKTVLKPKNTKRYIQCLLRK